MQAKPFCDAIKLLSLGLVISVSPALISCSSKSKQSKEVPPDTATELAAPEQASLTPKAIATPANENSPRRLRVVRSTASVGGGELCGVIDETGKLIVPMGERSIREAFDFGDGQVYLAIENDRRVGLVTLDEKEIIPPQYGESLMYSSKSLNAAGGPFVMSVSGEEALYNLKGEKLKTGRSIALYDSPEFDAMGGPFIVITEEEDGPCEIISLRTGEKIHSETLLSCQMAPERFPVQVASPEKRYGYMDAKGEMVIPAQFELARAFHGGRAQVMLNLEHAIALCEEPVTPPHSHESCHKGLSWWQEDLDLCESGMIPSSACHQAHGRAYIDEQGNVISRFDYGETSAFSDGRARVMRVGLWGFIDPAGHEVIPPQYLHAEDFSEGVAAVKTFVNAPDGRILGPDDGNYGRIVTQDDRSDVGIVPESGFITQDGAFWIKGLCEAKSFDQGFAYVKACDAALGAFINREGKQVITNVHPDDVTIHQKRLWGPDSNLGGYGLLDTHGQWLVPYRLAVRPIVSDNMTYFAIDGALPNRQKSQASVYNDGWISENGSIIWPPGWDNPCTDTQGYIIWPDGACR